MTTTERPVQSAVDAASVRLAHDILLSGCLHIFVADQFEEKTLGWHASPSRGMMPPS